MANVKDWLRERFPEAKGVTLKRMVADRRVTVNGQPARMLSQPVAAGDDVRVDARQAPAPETVTLAPLGLVHEDADVLVVHKPAGLLTSTVPGETRPTAIGLVRAWLAARDPAARAGIIHRLDAGAQGLLVFSKNNAAYESLKQQFEVHSVERVYLAAVHGVPSPRRGRIESLLVEQAGGRVVVSRDRGRGEQAVSEYQVLETAEGRALVQVTLRTGRKHQIRVQLAGRGTPVVGDGFYGARNEAGPLLLAAVVLAFDHPRTGQRLRFALPMPAEIRRLFPESARPRAGGRRPAGGGPRGRGPSRE